MKNSMNIMNRTIDTEAIVNTMGFNCDAISTDREWRETRTTIKTESNYNLHRTNHNKLNDKK